MPTVIPEDAFIPRNDLERSLLALHRGDLDEQAFLQSLLGAEVFMPVRDEDNIPGFQRSAHARPLVVEAEDGTPVLLLFSAPERAKPVVAEFDGFKGGVLAEFRWILDKLDAAHGISLNPGLDVGYDLDTELVARLIAEKPAQ